MKDFVSGRWFRVAAPVIWLSIICALFATYDSPWRGLAWASFVLASAGLVYAGRSSARSIWETIDDVEAEPTLAVLPLAPVAAPSGPTPSRSRGETR